MNQLPTYSSFSRNTVAYYVEINCKLLVDVTEVYIADLVVCSTCFGHHYAHHQELKTTVQW